MNEGGTVCVATWGNPRGWRLAEYVSGNARVKAFSTLSILYELERPLKTIVVALDTLADLSQLEDGADYSRVEKEAAEIVKQYLCGVDASVVVLPGVLERGIGAGDRQIFRSEPYGEYLPLFLYATYKEGLRVEGELRLALDISHGVNFMPTLAYRAAEEAAAALATARVQRVELKVYQADPYPEIPPKDGDLLARKPSEPCAHKDPSAEPPAVRYNQIAKRRLEPWDLARHTSYEPSPKILTDSRGCDLADARGLPKGVMPLLGAYRLGALLELALLTKAIPVEEVEGAAEAAVGCLRKKRSVKRLDGGLKVESGTRLSSGFHALIHAHAVLTGARKLLKFTGPTVELAEATATFDEIKKLRELVRGSRVVKALVDVEISKLERLKESREESLQRFLTGSWKLYADVWRMLGFETGEGEWESDEEFEMFKRHFIAHAGFHIGIVQLRLRDNQLELMVHPNKWDEVIKVLKKVVEFPSAASSSQAN